MIYVGGRVLSTAQYRPPGADAFEDTPEWWGSLALLGGLVVLAGIAVSAGVGEFVALVGVGLFFTTAVLAGAEQIEFATSFGVGGLVWTAAGIALVLGNTPSSAGVLAGFGLSGGTAFLAGSVGALRARGRRTSRA